MTRIRDVSLLCAVCALCLCTQPAAAQDATETDPPSLDELLGLDEEDVTTDDSAAETAERERQEELERHLQEQEIAEAFTMALEQMELSATLLDESFDPGIGTQRIQEDVLANLDRLIEEAKNQQGGNPSSSSSSSSSSQQSPGRNQQQQEGQESQQPGQPQDGEGDGSGGQPARQGADPNDMIEETGTEWGNLPDRIRDMLFQGSRDTFSSMYDQLTSEYYRRLAEMGDG